MTDLEPKFPYGFTLQRACLTPAEFTQALVSDLEGLIMSKDPMAEPFSVKIRSYMERQVDGTQTAAMVIQRINGESDAEETDASGRLSIAKVDSSVLYDLQDHLVSMYSEAGVEFLSSDEIISWMMEAVEQGDFDIAAVNQRMSLSPGPTKVAMNRLLEVNYTFEPAKLIVGISIGFEYEINDAESRREEAKSLGLKVELPDSPRRQAFFYDERTFETLPIFN